MELKQLMKIKAIKDTTNPYEMRKAAHDVYEEKYGGDN